MVITELIYKIPVHVVTVPAWSGIPGKEPANAMEKGFGV